MCGRKGKAAIERLEAKLRSETDKPKTDLKSPMPKGIAVLSNGKWMRHDLNREYRFKSNGTVDVIDMGGKSTRTFKWVAIKPDASVIRLDYLNGWVDTFTYVSNTEWSVTPTKNGRPSIAGFRLIKVK